MRSRLVALAVMALSLGASSPLVASEGSAQGSSMASEAVAGSGSETVCKNGTMIRRVKVGVGGEQRGCKVSYLKETEEPQAGEKILWNAQQESSYCQEKAQGFVEKLKGMGWSCE